MVHEIHAELPGSILEVLVVEGAAVAEGDVLLLLESMKMEIPVLAGVAGAVRSLPVVDGDLVRSGDLVATIESS